MTTETTARVVAGICVAGFALLVLVIAITLELKWIVPAALFIAAAVAFRHSIEKKEKTNNHTNQQDDSTTP